MPEIWPRRPVSYKQLLLVPTSTRRKNPKLSTPHPRRLSSEGTAAPEVRRPLGRVIELLAQGRRRAALAESSLRQAPTARPVVPEGARYLERRHVSAFGISDYRLFVPSPREVAPLGLVLMLHGCTQSADDFAAGTRMNEHAERHNLIAIYPQQDRAANQMACWNWFRSGDQHSDRGEPALLADLASSIAEEFSVGSGSIFAAGLSAGGAMAAILGRTHRQVFCAVGVHSGLAPGVASDVAGAYAAMRGQGAAPKAHGAPVSTIVFHGSADTVVHPSNAERVLAAALGNAVTTSIESKVAGKDGGGRKAICVLHRDAAGRTLAESWMIEGAGHAWSSGSPLGSYTDPVGPDASAEMIRFFLSSRKNGK